MAYEFVDKSNQGGKYEFVNESADKPSFTDSLTPELYKAAKAINLMRQLGLTARYGIEGAGDTLDFLASPLRGAVNLALPEGRKIEPGAGRAVAGLLGLPKEESDIERLSGDVSRGLAGVGALGGISSIIPKTASAIGNGLKSVLSVTTPSQLIAGGGAGGGAGIVRESGGSPEEQVLGGLLGGIVAPGLAHAGSRIGHGLHNVKRTVGASYGNQKDIESLAKQTALSKAGESRDEILSAIYNRPKLIPGVEMNTAEAIAYPQIGKPGQFGGATIRMQRDLRGAAGLEDIIPGAERTREILLKAEKKAINNELFPIGKKQLDAVNAAGGADSGVVLSKIDNMLADKGIAEVSKRALTSIRKNILEKTDDAGKIDAFGLYTTRKEIGLQIKNASKDTNNWDKKVTGMLEKNVQRAIDETLETSGARDWRSAYMDPYSSRMGAIEAMRGTTKEAGNIAKGVKPQSPTNIVPNEIPKIPTLLSRPMMAVNFGLRMIERDANTPVAKELAKRLLDPDEYAKLLQVDPKTPLGQQVRKVLTTATMIGQSQAKEVQPQDLQEE